MRRLFIVCTLATMLCSCYTSRILVGDVKPKEPVVEVAKSHDAHFIGGLVKTAKNVAEEHIGDAENYLIRSQYGFGDIVLSAITAGIYTPTTTKYFIPVRDLERFTPQEKKVRPEKDNGFMLMTDLNAKIAAGGVGLDVVAGYKFMNHFFAGIGLNVGFGGSTLIVKEEKSEGIVKTREKQSWSPQPDAFLRLRYLLFNAKSTPFVNLDLGACFPDAVDINWPSGVFSEDVSHTSMILTPSVGYQMRVGKNVAMTGAVGYRIDSGTKASLNSTQARATTSGILVQFGVNFML